MDREYMHLSENISSRICYSLYLCHLNFEECWVTAVPTEFNGIAVNTQHIWKSEQ